MRPGQGLGAGKGPRGKGGKGNVGPRRQAGWGVGAGGDQHGARQGMGSGAPPQPDVQTVRCIPTGIQQMPAHHAHHHHCHHCHHHHHTHLYNIDPDLGDLIPPKPPGPPSSWHPTRTAAPPAAPLPRHESRGRSWRGWPQAQEPQAEPAQGAEGAQDYWARDWDTVPDPLGGEALPVVMEVYGWLSLTTSGITRGLRNRPFDAVLFWIDGRNREVPPGGWVAREDHERVLRDVIRAGWPDREAMWPAPPEGGPVLCVTDAAANNWLPRALRTALIHWGYRPRNPPPPQPQPPHKRRRR